jgi:hypothetical protein
VAKQLGDKKMSEKDLRPKVTLFLIFMVLCLAFVFEDGLATNVSLNNPAPISSDDSTLLSALGYTDSYFYLSTGLDLRSPLSLSSDSNFALRQWPPGMPVLYGILSLIPKVPIGISLGVLTAVLWATCASLSISKAKTTGTYAVGIALWVILLTSQPLKSWIFGSGILYTEGISNALACLAMILLVNEGKERSESRFFLVVIGVLLALAAHFKATFEFTILIGTVILIVARVSLWLVSLILKSNRRSMISNGRSASLGAISKKIIIFSRERSASTTIFYTAFALTIPWRLTKNFLFYRGTYNFEWTHHTSQYWGHRWMPSAWLEEKGSGWFAENGGNSGCILDPNFCDFIALNEVPSGGEYGGNGFYSQSDFRKFTVETMLENPVRSFTTRAEYFWKAWSESGSALWVALTLSAFAVALVFGVLKTVDGRQRSTPAGFVFYTSILGVVIPLLLQEIEPRYLIPLQILPLVVVYGRFLEVRDEKFGISRSMMRR